MSYYKCNVNNLRLVGWMEGEFFMEINMIQLITDLMDTQGVAAHLHQYPYENIQSFDGGFRRKLYETYNYSEVIKWLEGSQDNTIYMMRDQFEVHYMIFKVPFTIIDHAVAEYITIGPYILENHDQLLPVIIERNQLPLYHLAELKEYYCGIPMIPAESTLESMVLVLAQYILGDDDKFEIDRSGTNFNWSLNMTDYEIEFGNALSMSAVEERYRAEDELLEAVGQGDFHKAMICINAFIKYRIQPRTSDSLRGQKNWMIVLNSLYRKAVQKAEVHPAHIDNMSASFAKRIEASGKENDLNELFKEMIRKYCLLVQNHSLQGYSHIIQNVINYIDFNLTEPLTLKYLSEKVLVNSSYLSAQFKKELGKTLTDYVNQKRIQSALILLATTDLPIQIVAEKVGIYDENYFSRLFKRIQNITAREYRCIIKAKNR